MLAMFFVVLVGCGKKKEEKQYEQVGALKDGPSCVIQGRNNSFALGAPIKEFAKTNGFRECEVPHYSIYSGPGYLIAMYKNDQFVIRSYSINRSAYLISAYKTNYSLADFERLTNALIMTLEKALPGKIQVNPRPQEPEVESGLSGGGKTNLK